MEVVVVGGGMAGAGAAYQLACAGVEVTVVDRNDQGGATAAGAGIVPCATADVANAGSDPLAPLLNGACAHYRELIARLSEDGEEDLGYAVVGALLLARTEEQRRRLARDLDGISAVDGGGWVDGSTARDLFPALRGDIEALHMPGYARVDGGKLRSALLSATQRRNGKLLEGDARLVSVGRGAVGVEVEGQRIDADAVVLAAGAGGRELGSALEVVPQRGQIVHLALSEADVAGWPIVIEDGSDCFCLVPFPSNRVVVGSTFENGVGFDCRVTGGGQVQLLSNALGIAPALADATVLETRVGLRPKSPDDLPLLGAEREIENLFIVNGLGRIGLTLGPYVGALVADLAVGKGPASDLAAFDPGRFSTGA